MIFYHFQVLDNNEYKPKIFSQYLQNQVLRNNYKAEESNTEVLQASKNSNIEDDKTSEQLHSLSSSSYVESRSCSSSNPPESTPEVSQSTSSIIIKSISKESQSLLSLSTIKSTSDDSKYCLNTTFIESPSKKPQLSSSLSIIESTPEKVEEEPKVIGVDSIDAADHIDKQETQDVRFLPVNQFRLKNDKERTMCIKQQKNSWLQLNDSKKDFQSAIEKSSAVTGQLSILKRDREEQDGGKRVVKRKISDYFSPKR